jgi:cell division protein FtsW (lipid II flippase)
MPKIVGSENFISKQLSLEQRERIAEFNDPCHKYEDSGYQVCHGFIAINSGGVTGSGLGESTQKFLYLPEAYTDFIFPIIVEELGVVTAGIILIMYLVLLMQILTIAVNAVNLRDSIIAFGTFCYILAHIVVNLGGVLALMPLTGVPLPFLSYGGSFLINLLVLIGLTQRVHINTKLAKAKKKA